MPNPNPTALLTGYLLNIFLQGALTVQTYGYSLDYPRDRLYLKAIVYSLFAVETIQAGVLLFETFASFASGRITPFASRYLVGVSAALFPSLVAVITQAPYAYRIYVLSRSRWLAGVVVLLSAIQFVTGITMSVSFIRTHLIENPGSMPQTTFRLMLAWFGVWALCDITIATIMVLLLVRNNTINRSTRRLVRKIICLTVETGVITAGASITSLALLAAYPFQIYVVATSMSLEKWCSITFIAQLNSRARQCDDVVDGSPDGTRLESVMFRDSWSTNQTLSRHRGPESGKRMVEETDL